MQAWTIWLIVGFILIALETIIPGVFVIWFGLSSVVVGLLLNIIDMSLLVQCILFCSLATVLSIFSYKFYHKKEKEEKVELNNFQHSMLNNLGIVEEFVDEENIGRGVFGDTTWKIKSKEKLIKQDKIKVIDVENTTLIVEKI